MGDCFPRWLVAAALVFIGTALLPCAADAAKEYCPASVAADNLFTGSDAGLFSYVLSAESARAVDGEIVAETNLGWFRFPFNDAAISVDHAQFALSHSVVTSDRYWSNVHYARFPEGVTMVARLWVAHAQAKGDGAYGWEARGAVDCDPPAGVGVLGRHSGSETFGARVNPLPFDLKRQPQGLAVVAALASGEPGDESCQRPFTNAVVTEPHEAGVAGGLDEMYLPTNALVKVAVSATGEIDDAWLFRSSGSARFDGAALRAARMSKYQGGTALCRPVPGVYVFRAEAW